MNKGLFDIMEEMEKERGISHDALLQGIVNALKKSVEQTYGTSDNLIVDFDEEEREMHVYRQLEVVEELEPGRENLEITLKEAQLEEPSAEVGDLIMIELNPKNFGRIAAQNGKNVIVQKIREQERQSLADYFSTHMHNIMTGVVRRVLPDGVATVSLGKMDAVLQTEDMLDDDMFVPDQRIKVYLEDIRERGKQLVVKISRTHPNMVRRLLESEIAEIKDGTVEIKSIAREAGKSSRASGSRDSKRTKVAVASKDPNVDPVGACIGVGSTRLDVIRKELSGERIDVIAWDPNPANFIENALSPAKVIAVSADEEERSAIVIVPDDQLSLAIGIKGQNARLAARLTGYKIDIKSESQARECGFFDEFEEEPEEAYEEETTGETGASEE